MLSLIESNLIECSLHASANVLNVCVICVESSPRKHVGNKLAGVGWNSLARHAATLD